MPNLWFQSASNIAAILAKAPRTNSSWVWVVAAALIGLAWFALSRWNQYRAGDAKGKGSAKGLFADLASAHRLTRIERSLLSEAAAAQELRDPAMVFVDPQALRGLAASKDAKAAEFAALARKLFG
jgi:hypothetical protein